MIILFNGTQTCHVEDICIYKVSGKVRHTDTTTLSRSTVRNYTDMFPSQVDLSQHGIRLTPSNMVTTSLQWPTIPSSDRTTGHSRTHTSSRAGAAKNLWV